MWGSIPANGLKIVFSSFILIYTPNAFNILSCHTDRQTNGRTDTGHDIVASAMKQIATKTVIVRAK